MMDRSFRIFLAVMAICALAAADHYLFGGLFGDLLGEVGGIFP